MASPLLPTLPLSKRLLSALLPKSHRLAAKAVPRLSRTRIKPRLQSLTIEDFSSGFSSPAVTQRARLDLYRFLRASIPVLNSVVWTWVRLCAADFEYRFTSPLSSSDETAARKTISELDKRIHRDGLMKLGGFRELLVQFFDALFTDGAVCGELQLTPSMSRIDRFLLADLKTIEIERSGDSYRLYQTTGDTRTPLNPHTLFYYGLSARPGTLLGSSILTAVPFVARVEQALVSDMHGAMRSAGYHRIHVKITPPERRSDESEEDYINRANSYFDDTVGMMRDFSPDSNPVTWDDVKIEYIGPANRTSSATAWYLNHKAMIEDACAGTHLAPFMLGYAYGTTHNWAEFKYDLMLRQVESVQQAAVSLLDWIVNIELSLSGSSAQVAHYFVNRAHVGLIERMQAEKVALDNVITRLDHKLITAEEAQRELQRAHR